MFRIFGKNTQLKYSQSRVDEGILLREQLTMSQPVYSNKYSENKKHNLALAVDSVNNLAIHKNEVFSFWGLIGEPSEDKGYAIARQVSDDQIAYEPGGGLCQLSALIYFLGIKCGLEIMERHAHTYDIYSYDKRYTPLGSDADVMFDIKDLKIKNTLNHPIAFRFEINEDILFGSVCSASPMHIYQIEFEEERQGELKLIKTFRSSDNTNFELLNVSAYRDFLNIS